MVRALPVLEHDVVAQQARQHTEGLDGTVASENLDPSIDSVVGQHSGSDFVEVEAHPQKGLLLARGITAIDSLLDLGKPK